MNVSGDVTVTLPFTLDFCAKGPDVEPMVLAWDGIDVTIYFPPSMSDGTIGQSFFASGWAWWTGTTLRLTLSEPVDAAEWDFEDSRRRIAAAANEVLRRFLNAYRIRMRRPDVHPVLIDAKRLELAVANSDGTRENLPEPEEAFFYRSIPAEAPLLASINSTTTTALQGDILGSDGSDINDQLLLDAAWLESLGEKERADRIRRSVAPLLKPT